MFTNIPVSNMSECNEFYPDYNTSCSTTLLTKLKEWTGAIHHPSVHEIPDFDKPLGAGVTMKGKTYHQKV